MPKEMKILIPTIKIKESVKCCNTAQAYKIFRSLLDYEAVDLKKQGISGLWLCCLCLYCICWCR